MLVLENTTVKSGMKIGTINKQNILSFQLWDNKTPINPEKWLLQKWLKIYNNENLEFLGDRVVGLILSKKIFDLYPHDSEGLLDKRFANLVNRKICRDTYFDANMPMSFYVFLKMSGLGCVY